MTKPMSLVTYCGGYCDDCWIRNGKIRETATTLQATLRGWAVPERAKALATLEPAAAHYGEFEGVLDWIHLQTYLPGVPGSWKPLPLGRAHVLRP